VIRYPIVSIVTVVYNSASDIEATICSVLNLSYTKIQYIVVDGGSTDGTLSIIEKYRNRIDVIISEPDKGIYDAMNKSISYCNGEWVNFMNSGDKFNSPATVDEIFENIQLHKNDSLIYGKHKVAYGNKILPKTSNPISELWKGMTIQHQSIFLRKSILEVYPFNTSYKFAADYDLVYNCYKRGLVIRFVNIFVSIVSANGVSESNSFNTYAEFKKIALHYEGDNRRITKYYYFTLINRRIISIIKNTLPFLDKARLFLK
jgi:putative colanic acid biosynthesis glycosyltransferase